MSKDAATRFRVSKNYSWYALFVLWLVALFRFVDLQIIAVLLESIRQEFTFSDVQLAMLGGLAFAVLYSTLGLPVAWLADRYSRRNIVSAAVFLWSLMTLLCGYAEGFLSLFIFRMGVGIGEAGGYPPTTSLLADYFPTRQRSFAFSILGSAVPLGVLVGFLLGGVVNHYYGWRAAFILMGGLGMGVALLTWTTLKEPPRGYSETTLRPIQAPPMMACLSYFWQLPAFRHVVLAACLLTLGSAASGIWIPSFFIRHHGMSSAEVGVWLALIYGGGGLAGTIMGGLLGDRLSQKYDDPAISLKLCAVALLLALPCVIFVYLWPNPYQALLVQGLVAVLMHVNLGPVLATVQGLAGVSRRSMAQAVNVLVTNLVALSLGPLLVGLGSDLFSPALGSVALGYAIMIVVLFSFSWSTLHFFRAARSLKKDLQATANEEKDRADSSMGSHDTIPDATSPVLSS